MKLGSGILSWDGLERRSQRYGSIVLCDTTFDEKARYQGLVNHPAFDSLTGKRVKLTAQILETRASGHLGDLLLGITPQTPTKGESIVIGVGWLHKTDITWGTAFELWPAELLQDCPKKLWLDPRTLYRLHDQTIALWAEETHQPIIPVQPFENVKDFVEIEEPDGRVAFQHSDAFSGVKRDFRAERVEGTDHCFALIPTGTFSPIPKK